jgi:PAS domain-containing protein
LLPPFAGSKRRTLLSLECAERIRLIEEYSRSVTDFNARLETLKRSPHQRTEADWRVAETARAEAQGTWAALEQHIVNHRCLDVYRPSLEPVETPAPSRILERAAEAALDIILVADNDRRFVDVNQAAADVLGLPRDEIVGRRIEEFFSEARGETIPQAWNSFVTEGIQHGICELAAPGRRRRFEYRAKANFAPGLHLSVLRELYEIVER